MATSPFNNLDGQKYHPEESHYHRSHDSKHAELEFPLALTANEVSLVFWTGVFLSPGRRIRVIGKETGPGPGGYG